MLCNRVVSGYRLERRMRSESVTEESADGDDAGGGIALGLLQLYTDFGIVDRASRRRFPE